MRANQFPPREKCFEVLKIAQKRNKKFRETPGTQNHCIPWFIFYLKMIFEKSSQNL